MYGSPFPVEAVVAKVEAQASDESAVAFHLFEAAPIPGAYSERNTDGWMHNGSLRYRIGAKGATNHSK